MCFAAALKEVRTSAGLSQQVFAGLVGVNQPYFSKLEKKVARVLNSSRLHTEYVYEKKAECFNVPVLNNVDDHVIVVLGSLIEEVAVLISIARSLVDGTSTVCEDGRVKYFDMKMTTRQRQLQK